MEIINLCEHNSLVGQFMSEIRDKNLQQERLRFRTNIQRLGQIMAYEISKTLQYGTVGVETPLGVKQCNVLSDRVVLATILRAGLPVHQGLARCGFFNPQQHFTQRTFSAARFAHQPQHPPGVQRQRDIF